MGVIRTSVTVLSAVLLATGLIACGAPPPEPAVPEAAVPEAGVPEAAATAVPLPVPVPVEPTDPLAPVPPPADAGAFDPAAVPGCERGGCELRFDIARPDGGRFAGVQVPPAVGGFPRGVLAVRTADGDVRTDEPVEAGYVTPAVACGEERCVVVFEVGAHGVEALVVEPGTVTVSGRAPAGTPEAVPIDLDGDDRVDVALRESTGDPSYAAAPRFWQTFRQTPDGSLERTGCGETVAGPEDAPVALLTGECVAR